MGISDQANNYLDKLGETDLLILGYILKNKELCCHHTIEQMASKCNVSRTTVLRFTQKLGFSGYSEMKARLKWECQQESKLPDTALQSVCDDYHKLIDDMRDKDCTEICRLLRNASRVFVYGTGAVQSYVARELKRAFLSARLLVNHIDGSHDEAALTAELIDDRDVVIVISLSGESERGVELARSLKSKGVPVISLTRLKNNTLAHLSTHNLYVVTSTVGTVYPMCYETTTLFFMTVELLLLKYLLYVNSL
ncbi:MAG: MurR/RpiR family transcriptional regulator [Synergistaceae bacterium]|nr:MurR/RpiR family transcriptional regulator [Synergistaceae bacterium]